MEYKSDPNLKTREPRFRVKHEKDTQVTVTRRDPNDLDPIKAELVDISHRGAKLGMKLCPRFQESLRLQIDIPSRDVHYEGVALVRNIRSNGIEGWLVGCTVQPPLPSVVYSHLAAVAGIDRRKSTRKPISLPATLRKPLESDRIATRLLNVSPEGLCVWSDAEMDTGDRLSIGVVGPDQQIQNMEVRVLWRVVVPDGCMVGCSFNDSIGYATILSCLQEQSAKNSSVARTERPMSRLTLAAAILAIALPPALTILLETRHAEATSQQVAQVEPADTEAAHTLAGVAHKPARELDPLVEVPSVPAQPQADNPPSENPNDGSSWREFSDNTGRYHTMARLLEVHDNHILLRKQNGHFAKVPLHRLSPASIEYVHQWQSAGR